MHVLAMCHAVAKTVPPAIWSRDDVTNEDSLFTFPIAGHETVRACQSLQSDELGAVVWDAAVLLSWFLCQQLDCQVGFLTRAARALATYCTTFVNLLLSERSLYHLYQCRACPTVWACTQATSSMKLSHLNLSGFHGFARPPAPAHS
ncbi:yitU [Symbiodinium natans]|uniref:YitU protein n=1 Tax=Symbiodinium natans TaxID=878477 RepID=A0A812U732_9DINO|nr:yitU [Symbiodinium natans]